MELSEVQEAREKIQPYLQKTPLVQIPSTRFYLKCEHLQVTNSFKTRPAFNTLLNVKGGVITRSPGNFGKALACAGQALNVPVTIVMPTTAPQVKKEGVKSFGARLVLHGTTHAEGQAKVHEIAEQEGLTVLSPYDYADVIVGDATLALEIRDELPSIKHFVAPIGGGGLLSGTAFVFKTLDSNIETIGVEPEGAGDYFLSCKEGKRVTLQAPKSIADGLLAPTVGDLNWPLLQAHVDRSLLVTEQEIVDAMRYLYTELGMIVEPSGAVSVAALLSHPELQLKGDTVAVVSGGNVDLNKFYDWIK